MNNNNNIDFDKNKVRHDLIKRSCRALSNPENNRSHHCLHPFTMRFAADV